MGNGRREVWGLADFGYSDVRVLFLMDEYFRMAGLGSGCDRGSATDSRHNFPFPVCGGPLRYSAADNGPSRGSTQDIPSRSVRFDAFFDPSILEFYTRRGCGGGCSVNGCPSVFIIGRYALRHPRQANSRLSRSHDLR